MALGCWCLLGSHWREKCRWRPGALYSPRFRTEGLMDVLLPEHFERDCVECINTLNFIWCLHSVSMNSGSSGRDRKSYYPCTEHTQTAQYPGRGLKHKTKIVMQVLSRLLSNCSIFLFIFFFKNKAEDPLMLESHHHPPPPWQKSKRREALPPPPRSGCSLLTRH